MMKNDDSELLLLVLLLQTLSDEDDPFLGEMLYDKLRRRLREPEWLTPDIDHLLKRRLHYPRRSKERRLSESREIAVSVLEGFRKSFEESTNEKLNEIKKIILKIVPSHAIGASSDLLIPT